MRSDTVAAAPVAVVGGGFAGTMTAVHLARRGIPVRLFEPGAEPGRGLAYGTPDPIHLLNVPAAKMSAFGDQPDHFRSWADAQPGAFMPRQHFGTYVSEILAAQPHVTVDRTPVVAMERAGSAWQLTLGDGRTLAAPGAVLALGNEPPAVPEGWEGLPIIANPWSKEATVAIEALHGEDGDVLLIGTGLTMIDVALSLDKAGFRGGVFAFSRRGLLPRAHGPAEPAPVSLDALPRGDLLALWRWLRTRSAEVGFRAAVDSLRPHTAALWTHLPPDQRRRFLRHARPWWDVHRHRIAPEVSTQLEAWLASGWLQTLRARLSRIEGDTVVLRRHSGEEQSVTPRLVVNCTGPLGDVRRTRNRLLADLIASGTVRTDPLGLGLQTDDYDRAADRLWALGPLTKGMYWEITAVPDIRVQAERVAEAIAKELLTHG